MTAITQSRGSVRNWGLLTGLALVFWLLIGLADCAWYVLMLAAKGVATPWARVLYSNLPYWILAALLTPCAVFVARHTPVGRGHWRRALPVHLGTLIPFAVVHVVAFQSFLLLVLKKESIGFVKFLSLIPKIVAAALDKEILLYLVIVGGAYLGQTYVRYREQERAAAALELERAELRASLSEARLQALRMQLQPHFLFNTLHAISTLILKGESKPADQMLAHLSRFLRMTLENSDSATVPLAVELDFLDAYLRIQKVRFGDRLTVSMDIDQMTLAANVPSLILQPLVENSIHHGIGPDPDGGEIRVRSRVAGGRLVLQVEDNGAGPSSTETAEGIGLKNIRARLTQLYPEEHSFSLRAGEHGGALATIAIPFRRAEREEESGFDSHHDRG